MEKDDNAFILGIAALLILAVIFVVVLNSFMDTLVSVFTMVVVVLVLVIILRLTGRWTMGY